MGHGEECEVAVSEACQATASETDPELAGRVFAES
jgi:hypothetical protein